MGLNDSTCQNTFDDRPLVASNVTETMKLIIALFGDGNFLEARSGALAQYGLSAELGSDEHAIEDLRPLRRLFERFSKISRRQEDTVASRSSTVRWVIQDRARFVDLVTDLRELIDDLESLTYSTETSRRRTLILKSEIDSLSEPELNLVQQASGAGEDEISDTASDRLEVLSRRSILGSESICSRQTYHTAMESKEAPTKCNEAEIENKDEYEDEHQTEDEDETEDENTDDENGILESYRKALHPLPDNFDRHGFRANHSNGGLSQMGMPRVDGRLTGLSLLPPITSVSPKDCEQFPSWPRYSEIGMSRSDRRLLESNPLHPNDNVSPKDCEHFLPWPRSGGGWTCVLKPRNLRLTTFGCSKDDKHRHCDAKTVAQCVKKRNQGLLSNVHTHTLAARQVSSRLDSTNLIGVVPGPRNSRFKGALYFVRIRCDTDFPRAPPEVAFLTKLSHPEVDHAGAVNPKAVKSVWKSKMTFIDLLSTISSLLAIPKSVVFGPCGYTLPLWSCDNVDPSWYVAEHENDKYSMLPQQFEKALAEPIATWGVPRHAMHFQSFRP